MARAPRGGDADRDEQEQRAPAHGTSSMARGIADALVLKDGDVFFLCEPDGRVPLDQGHGLGLYYHDCRYLSGYELEIGGARPNRLVSEAGRGYMAIIEATNPDLRTGGGDPVAKQRLGIKWERIVEGSQLALHDLITVRNFSQGRVEVQVSFAFRAGFEDIFTVRGMVPEERGALPPPEWRNGVLWFRYRGRDGLHRSTSVHFSPAAPRTEASTARFTLGLDSQETRQLLVSVVLAESARPDEVEVRTRRGPDPKRVAEALHRSSDEWLGGHTEVSSDSLVLNRILERSLRDLRVLRTTLRDEAFFAAGVPWFVTLFGRDSIIASLEALAYRPEVAAETLRLLASYQGSREDEWKDEAPGKILHELRVGELARSGQIPYTPYYGTVDATPLFLILVARHAAWTGDLALFEALAPHVDRALAWISRAGQRDGRGYLAYEGRSERGLVNQGWKDSGDAIVNADGSLATPPIALVEVQGYAYFARTELAGLYERAGDADRARRLRGEAEALRSRFNRDFWLEDRGFYALALEAGGRLCAVLSSNPGHALWAGIADPDKAAATARALMRDDMFSGWGVRTLSSRERRYNPIGYHLGTVWPHDNAILAAGFRRYGLDDEACRIGEGIVRAAMHFAEHRLPELFAGFSRDEYGVPVHYPVACRPQAWAAGSVPFLLETLLGLAPDALERRLRIVRPVLPGFVRHVTLRGLRVGRARADLSFDRTEAGAIGVTVDRIDGQLDVIVDPAD